MRAAAQCPPSLPRCYILMEYRLLCVAFRVSKFSSELDVLQWETPFFLFSSFITSLASSARMHGPPPIPLGVVELKPLPGSPKEAELVPFVDLLCF